MRVLHVSASFPRTTTDSTAPFLLDLVQIQRAAGIDAHVVGLHDAGLPTRAMVGSVPVRRARYAPGRWEVLAFRGGGHARLRNPAHVALLPGMVASMWAATALEARRLKPDVVHAHWLLPNALVAALVPHRARLVVTLHGNDVTLAATRLANPLARLVVRRADTIVAVSEGLARTAEGLLGLGTGSIGITELPVPAELVASPLPESPLRLLAAGRASREKGFDVLLDALARPEASGWSATLVTEGPERADLQRRASALGDRVRLLALQPRRDLFDLMRQHHLVVVPSRSEGLGLLAVEALAAGRPVIASRVGGLPEVVEPGVDGDLVAPDDVPALAGALGRLLEPGALRAPAASRVARHRPDAVVASHRAAYGSVAR